MNRRWVVYFVSFASFLGPFTQTIYTPMLPEFTAYYHTTVFLINFSISIFTVCLALMQMVYGPLTDAKGRRKVLLFGVLLLMLASLGCYWAPTILWLLVFRSLQAIGIAAGSVVATTVIADLYAGKSRGRAMGTFQMMVSLGPVIGPVVGGFVGGAAGFRTVFLVLAGTGLLVFLINLGLLPETKPEQATGEPFRLRGFLDILADPLGSAVIALGFVQYYAYYNFLVFLPDLLGRFYGLTAEQKGMVFLPLSFSIVVGSYLGGRAQEKRDGRRFLVRSSLLNAAAIVLFLLLANLSLPLLIVAIVAFGLCMGLSLPVQATLLTFAFQANRATAVGVYNFFRYMGMAAGPMLGTLLFHLGRYVALFGFAAIFFAGTIWFARRQFRLTANSGEEAL